MFHVDFDDSCEGLVLYTVLGSPANREELQRLLLDHLEARYTARTPTADVYDLRLARRFTGDVGEYLTAWLAIQRRAIRRTVLATAVVVNSVPIKLFVSGLFLFQPPPAKAYSVHTQRPTALNWAARRLDGEGIAYDREALSRLLDGGNGNGNSIGA